MADFSKSPTPEQFQSIVSLAKELWESPRSDFYRNFWSKREFNPAMLKEPADFLRVPILRKKDLIAAQQKSIESILHFPELVHYIRATSGTTSKAEENIILTFQNDVYKSSLQTMGFSMYKLSKRPMVVEPPGGTVRDITIFHEVGSLPVIGDIFELQRSAYIGVKAKIDGIFAPAQIIPPLIDTMESKYGYSRENIKAILLMTGTAKELAGLRQLLPYAYILVGQGMSEYGIAFGHSCEYIGRLDFRKEHTRCHLTPYTFLEIVNPLTEKPVAPEERGEILLTALVKAPTTLIRYATGDEGYIFGGATCPCGRPGPLFRLTRRLEPDFVWAGAISLWADEFEAAVKQFSGELEPAFSVNVSEETVGYRAIPRIVLELIPKSKSVEPISLSQKMASKIAITGRHNLADVIAAGLCMPIEIRFVDEIPAGTPKLTSDIEY